MLLAPSGATFVTSGPRAGSLVFAGLCGESLYRVVLDPADPRWSDLSQSLISGQRCPNPSSFPVPTARNAMAAT